ncbi:MAG: CFI-box-CTERM domain-containing protein [Candidatus Omnitrophota bacterium]
MRNRKILRSALKALFGLWLFSMVSEAGAQSITTYIVPSPLGTDVSDPMLNPNDGTDILPFDTLPVAWTLTDTITVVATPGEYEPASFVLRPDYNLTNLTLTVSNLTGDAGEIPSSSVDIKVVKCWYQATWSGETLNPQGWLVPELLLNDDTLIEVDYTGLSYAGAPYGSRLRKMGWPNPLYGNPTGRNWVKLSFPAPRGEEYYWINNPYQTPWDAEGRPENFPIKDSPVLLPVDIAADTNKQFWVTVKVPEDAAAGIYTGAITPSAGKTIFVKLEVLPFKLASPKTYYDLNREFTSSIYYTSAYSPISYPNGAVFTFAKSSEQLRAELANLVAHGVTNPICAQDVSSGSRPFLGLMLEMRQEAGMTSPTLYSGSWDLDGILGTDFHWSDKGIPIPPEKLDYLEQLTASAVAFCSSYGISEVYFYGKDEGFNDSLRRQRPAWEAIHKGGGKIFVAGYRPGRGWGPNYGLEPAEGSFEIVGDIQDLFVCEGPTLIEEADKWHYDSINLWGSGSEHHENFYQLYHKIWCYANPQADTENPAPYRKNYGFRIWKSNYDGAATWAYMSNHYNDFRMNAGDYNGWIWGIVYSTVNGVIDTIAWEGYREAIDDIRYGTTLMELIKQAEDRGLLPAEVQAAKDYLEDLDEKYWDRTRGDYTHKSYGTIRSEIIELIKPLVIPTYTVTSFAGLHGTISPLGPVEVVEGDTPIFKITPDTWYHISDVLVGGVSVGAVSSYTFDAVYADSTISAEFEINRNDIYGKVTDSATLANVAGVAITLSSLEVPPLYADLTETTDGAGEYSFLGVSAGYHKFTPSLTGRVFVPTQTELKPFTAANPLNGIDFVAYPPFEIKVPFGIPNPVVENNSVSCRVTTDPAAESYLWTVNRGHFVDSGTRTSTRQDPTWVADIAMADGVLFEEVALTVVAYTSDGRSYSASYSQQVNKLPVPEVKSPSGSGDCFIATAAFGTPMAKEVITLRQFRDRFLLTRNWGRVLVRFYYRHSPAAAEFIRSRPVYCFLVRSVLRPLVWLVKAVL